MAVRRNSFWNELRIQLARRHRPLLDSAGAREHLVLWQRFSAGRSGSVAA